MNEITLETYQDYKDDINEIIEISQAAVNNFLSLGRLFKKINLEETYRLEDYKSIYEFAEDKFGYKTTSVKNFINVFDKYAEDPENYFYDTGIKEEFENYSFTSLVELLPVDSKEITVDYSPKMTIKEIRETKLISQLTDDIKERIEKYNYVVDLLKKEVEQFHNKLGKKIIKYFVSSKKYSLDDFDLDSKFEYNYSTFYIESNINYYLRLNFKQVSKDIQDEEIIDLFSKYLDDVQQRYESDVKREEQEKLQKQKEKEKKNLPYKEETMYNLIYLNKMFYSMVIYLEYIILKSDRNYYDLRILNYKEKKLYEYPVIYNGVEVGVFGYNDETMETYFKFKKYELKSNNMLDKEHDLYFITIDKDYKRCDLFSNNTLDLIKRYYNRIEEEVKENE